MAPTMTGDSTATDATRAKLPEGRDPPVGKHDEKKIAAAVMPATKKVTQDEDQGLPQGGEPRNIIMVFPTETKGDGISLGLGGYASWIDIMTDAALPANLDFFPGGDIYNTKATEFTTNEAEKEANMRKVIDEHFNGDAVTAGKYARQFLEDEENKKATSAEINLKSAVGRGTHRLGVYLPETQL